MAAASSFVRNSGVSRKIDTRHTSIIIIFIYITTAAVSVIFAMSLCLSFLYAYITHVSLVAVFANRFLFGKHDRLTVQCFSLCHAIDMYVCRYYRAAIIIWWL